MGAELTLDDSKMLENFDMLLDYESIKEEKNWPLFETLPREVFKASPGELGEVMPDKKANTLEESK